MTNSYDISNFVNENYEMSKSSTEYSTIQGGMFLSIEMNNHYIFPILDGCRPPGIRTTEDVNMT